jgi:protein-tyrosine phosphatase
MIKIPEAIKDGGKPPVGHKPVYQYHQSPSYYGNNNTVWEPSCSHKGDKLIYKRHGKELYAANNSGLDEYSGKWDLIIDLATIVKVHLSPFVKSASPERFHALNSLSLSEAKVKSEVLALDWPDMSAPRATLAFWQELWQMLPKKTVICCIGGHGRTGTCLASLMITDGIDYYSAVETVRADHCHKAIESLAQESYLHRLYKAKLRAYMDVAVAANDTVEIAEIQADLDYAEKYAPNSESYDGTKVKKETPKPALVVDKPKGSLNGSLAMLDQMGDVKTKIIGDRIYVEICKDKMCPFPDCNNPLHLGWEEWDPKSGVEWEEGYA